MNHQTCRPLLVLFSVGVMLAPAALADGGAVQAIHQSGGLVISVFTSPTMLAAGPVDVSVMVQDAESRVAIVNADVRVEIVPRDRTYLAERHEATSNLATNRLMKACHVPLDPGWHDVRVQASHKDLSGQVEFAMFVGAVPPRAASFWPWFTWPAIPIVMVAANLIYRRIRSSGSAIIKSGRPNF